MCFNKYSKKQCIRYTVSYFLATQISRVVFNEIFKAILIESGVLVYFNNAHACTYEGNAICIGGPDLSVHYAIFCLALCTIVHIYAYI